MQTTHVSRSIVHRSDVMSSMRMNLCSANTVNHEYIVPIQRLCAFIAWIALIDSFSSFQILHNFSADHQSANGIVCASESISVCVVMSRSILRATVPVFRSKKTVIKSLNQNTECNTAAETQTLVYIYKIGLCAHSKWHERWPSRWWQQWTPTGIACVIWAQESRTKQNVSACEWEKNVQTDRKQVYWF